MLKWLNNKDATDQRIGITFGAFDLLHGGHIAMLAEAKRNCDYLVVGLQNDPSADRKTKNSPVQSIFERQLQLSAVRFINDIIIYNNEKEIEDILLTLPIKVRIIGEDYLNEPFTGKALCEELGIDIVYNGRAHSFSTTELRKRVHHFSAEEREAREKERYEYDDEMANKED